MGESGTGKTLMAKYYLNEIAQDSLVTIKTNFSSQTNIQHFYDIFSNKDHFFKYRKDLIGPPQDKKGLIFIDDLNMPKCDEFGCQPPLELLRQIIDHGGYFKDF